MAEELSGGVTDYTKNGLVTKPVVRDAVAKLLGNTGKSIKSNSQASSIKFWAKYKPFNCGTMFFLQDSDSSKTDRDEALRLAYYGLTVPQRISASNISNIENYPWTYAARVKPFRNDDFINYNHNARCPIEVVNNAELNVYHTLSAQIVKAAMIGNYNLQFSEVFNTNTFANYHICLYLKGKYQNGNTCERLLINYYKDGNGNEYGSQWDLSSVYITTQMITEMYGDITFMLLATTQNLDSKSEMGTLVSIKTSSLFCNVPYNSVSEVKGVLSQKNIFGITASVYGLAIYGRRNGYLTDPTNYDADARHDTSWIPLYFRVYYYSIIIAFTLTNTTSSPITLYKSRWGVGLSRTFSSSSATTQNQSLNSMLTEDWQSVDSITIAAGSSKVVLFELPYDIYRGDSSSPTTQSIPVTINFYYSGRLNPVFTKTIYVKNG